MKEAERMGMSRVILPQRNIKGIKGTSVELVGVRTIGDALGEIFRLS